MLAQTTLLVLVLTLEDEALWAGGWQVTSAMGGPGTDAVSPPTRPESAADRNDESPRRSGGFLSGWT